MNNLFDSFSSQNLEQWQNQLVKDLKGQSEDLLKRQDVIEEVDYTTFQHAESNNATPANAWGEKYARGLQRETNAFYNVKNIVVQDEKSANEEALLALNVGANALRLENVADFDLTLILATIQLDVIQLRLVNPNAEQVSNLFHTHSSLFGTNIVVEWDAMEIKNNFGKIASVLKEKQFPTFIAQGYNVQQLGGNTAQEVAFILTTAHDALVYLMEEGLSIDQAAACIHINTGVGAKYFFEIAKVRVIRMLWTKIVEQYQPISACTKNMAILGMTGFINKSLKDPHTNLLRQTTELASLIIGGCDAIVCLPHDTFSTEGTSILAARMALNIPNVLVEESYLDKVIDPYAGSYAVEFLSNSIAEKAWALFTKFNATGGFTSTENIGEFKSAVAEKQALRKALFTEGKLKFIGVNSFPNPETVKGEWKSTGEYLGLPYLVYETIEA